MLRTHEERTTGNVDQRLTMAGPSLLLPGLPAKGVITKTFACQGGKRADKVAPDLGSIIAEVGAGFATTLVNGAENVQPVVVTRLLDASQPPFTSPAAIRAVAVVEVTSVAPLQVALVACGALDLAGDGPPPPLG